VDLFARIITRQAIRRGSFKSVAQLTKKIDDYIAQRSMH
jgi:hypothetical protein